MTLPRFLLVAITSLAPFFLYSRTASAAPTITGAVTAATATTSCPNLPPAQAAFLPTASAVWFDVSYTGENIGDQFQIEWFEPNGTQYFNATYSQPGTGTWCLWESINLANTPAANIPGTWTVKLIWNGTQIDSAQFSIVPVCTSATFSIPQGWAQNYLLPGGPTYITWSFVTTPASCAWTATGDSSALSVSPSSGTGPSTITATFPANNTNSVLADTVTLNSGGVTFTLIATRNPNSCSFTPSPSSLSFPAAGGTKQLSVSSNLSVCEWFLDTPSWLSGPTQLLTGSQTVNISAGANPGLGLSGNLTSYGVVSNLSIPVTQVSSAAVSISSLSPTSATAGTSGFTLTVNGNGFASGASVRWNSTALTTTFVNSGQLTAVVPANLIASAGTASITVVSGGTTTNSLAFAVNNTQAVLLTAIETAASGNCPSLPPPQSAFLSTATAVYVDFTYTGGSAGDVFTVQWLEPNGTLYNSSSNTPQPSSGGSYCWQYWIDIAGFQPANIPGTWTAKLLRNTTQISSLQFAIGPVCTGFSATSPQNILVSNAAYVNWSIATTPASCAWAATGDSAIQTISPSFGAGASSIVATFPPNNTTAVVTDTVTVTSGSTTFTLYATRNPNSCSFTAAPPSLNFPVSGGTQQLSVSSNLSGCLWYMFGPTWLTFPTQLLTGSQTVNITASANSGAALSGALTSYGLVSNLTVPVTQASSAAVTISSLSPTSATAGGSGFTLTVNGTGFTSASSVRWNGSGLSTTFVNSGQVTASVPSSLIASAGAASIIVLTGATPSNSVSFSINNSTLVLTSLLPATETAGGPAFTLTVNGGGFSSGATVQWNGSGLSTTFVNANQLTAAVPASLIASVGTASITVVSGGITSNGLGFATVLTSPSYLIGTVAGGGQNLGDGELAASAQLSGPTGVAVDAAGNLYIADSRSNRIRKVSAGTGLITTVAGVANMPAGYSGDGGLATSAQLNTPQGVAVDKLGNLYIADTQNDLIRMVAAGTGVITTVAGNRTAGFTGDGGPATSASISTVSGIAVDGSGNLYIADSVNARIRKVTAVSGNITGGIITTIAGSFAQGYTGDQGLAVNAFLNNPQGIAADAAGNLYIADTDNSVIRKVTASTGVITTIAGNNTYGDSGDGGPATSAQLENPVAVAVDSAGDLYIADFYNLNVRKVVSGTITTLAGQGTNANVSSQPASVAVGPHGQIFISDEFNGVGLVTLVNDSGSPSSETTAGNANSSDHLTFNLLIQNSSSSTNSQAIKGAAKSKENVISKARPRANQGNDTLTVGGTVSFTETLARDPSSPTASNVVVSGSVPPTYVITSCVVANGGACSLAGSNAVSVSYPTLSSGAAPSVSIIADGPASGAAQVDLNSTSSTNGLATASLSQTVAFSPGASIAPTLQAPASIPAGQVLQYTVTLANVGGDALAGDPISVTLTLDPTLTGVTVPPAPPWICTQTSAAVTCTDSAGLAGGGAEARFVVNGIVPASATNKNLSGQATFIYGGLPAVQQNVSTTVTGGQAPPAPTLSSPAQGATGVSTTASLTWQQDSGANAYNVYFGTSNPPPLATNTSGTSYTPSMNANTTYYWSVTAQNAIGSTPSAVWSFTTGAGQIVPAFFSGESSLGGGVYYLQFPNKNVFGYYNFPGNSIFYHYDMGYEGYVPGYAADIYLYDFTTTHWFYTSSSLFPYLYDFTLNAWLYYFPNTNSAGHYSANPRYFSNLSTGKIFSQ